MFDNSDTVSCFPHVTPLPLLLLPLSSQLRLASDISIASAATLTPISDAVATTDEETAAIDSVISAAAKIAPVAAVIGDTAANAAVATSVDAIAMNDSS